MIELFGSVESQVAPGVCQHQCTYYPDGSMGARVWSMPHNVSILLTSMTVHRKPP